MLLCTHLPLAYSLLLFYFLKTISSYVDQLDLSLSASLVSWKLGFHTCTTKSCKIHLDEGCFQIVDIVSWFWLAMLFLMFCIMPFSSAQTVLSNLCLFCSWPPASLSSKHTYKLMLDFLQLPHLREGLRGGLISAGLSTVLCGTILVTFMWLCMLSVNSPVGLWTCIAQDWLAMGEHHGFPGRQCSREAGKQGGKWK